VSSALEAYYSREKAFVDHPKLRLATLVVDRNDRFAREFETMGHTIQFTAATSKPRSDRELKEPDATETADLIGEFDASVNVARYPQLDEIIHSDWAPPMPSKEYIMTWIEDEYKKAMGFGLATISTSILPIL
jgi:hypothetical protein